MKDNDQSIYLLSQRNEQQQQPPLHALTPLDKGYLESELDVEIDIEMERYCRSLRSDEQSGKLAIAEPHKESDKGSPLGLESNKSSRSKVSN